jgi:nucleotide-binding universal stress UspA family protein
MTIHAILCPIDFSAPAEDALRYAVSLAARLRAEPVHVLHVHQAALLSGHEASAAQRAAKDHAARRLEDIAKRYSVHDVEVVPHFVEGVPYEAILSEATRLNADLIVMSTHGRSGLAHALIGSVAERVVRQASIPVCTVRKSS